MKNTKMAIALALHKLLGEYTLDSITVQDISDAAGVSRKTFYYHFKDIHTLLNWSFQHTLQIYRTKAADPLGWRDLALGFCKRCVEERVVAMNLASSMSRSLLEEVLQTAIRSCMEAILLDLNALGRRVIPLSPVIKDFIVYGVQGVFLHWIDSGMEESPEVFVARLGQLNQLLVAAFSRQEP